jgi:hypothetical protein
MKHRIAARLLATAISASLVVTPVHAKSAGSLQDLVGIRASAGESALQSRGFEFAKAGGDTADSRSTYWWNNSKDDCILVRTSDGRYVAISDASASDCGKSGGGSGAAVAAGVIGAAVLGAILLSRKDRNKPSSEGGYQQEWQQVEVYNLQTGSLRIFDSPSTNARVRTEVPAGTLLRNYGCEDYNGESWCEVSTINYRTRGWARDRYLRPAYGSGHYPDYGNTGGDMVQVYGVSNALTIASDPSKNSYIVGRVNAGTTLRKSGCEYVNGEQWCRVATLDGRMHGWARERYLRPAGSSGGYYPGQGSGGYYPGPGSGDMVQVYGVSGSLKITSEPNRNAYTVLRVSRGTTLRRSGCEYVGGENWCRVSTIDGRTQGWARERYLRPSY